MNDTEIIENINKNYCIVKNNNLLLENIKNKNEVIDLSLNSNKTLFIENCNDIIINITKINQIFIIKSNNIKLNYKKPIIGIFITNSNNIKLNEIVTIENTNTDITIELYNSNFINILTQNKNNIYIILYCNDIDINNFILPLNIFQCCCFMYNDIITYFNE
jgi:hypothetical protein